ncbi:unnamed protein product [Paramecium octaurelia]|uniref:TLDc domain-containing protein n=1 Tax=Paramecium octaurelia TaxID=43137 RepID=A0A8S1SS77_PAROT|nr:unnamed protein product [Paramecium octaurelia]
MEKQIGIYCQDDQHFHRGRKIKYLMVKKDKGSIQKRLFCDECFFGQYNSLQQHCCNLEELIKGRNYEAFKYTKFDSDYKQQYFNYARNHHPYLDTEFIQNMISSLEEEILSKIQDLIDLFKKQIEVYLNEVNKWTENPRITNYFNCDELKEVLLNEKFERSPEMFKELNEKAEIYVEKINKVDQKIDEEGIFKIDEIVSKQKHFFNLDRFNAGFKDIMQSIQKIEERTFSDYKFQTSTLATPYFETIVKKIAPGEEEKFSKNMIRIYRMTQHGSNYQTLQKIDLLQKANTITIIQTKNNCIFGVYTCIANPEKSILFQMNKEQFFQIKKNKKPLQLNLQANKENWILKFGDEDIVINSTFTQCVSKLGNGFDISGSEISNSEEYLANSKKFDVYDIEIFQTSQPIPIRITPPLIIQNQIPQRTSQGTQQIPSQGTSLISIPPLGSQGFTPLSGSQGSTPPTGSQGFTPPPGSQGFTPPPGSQGFTPPPGSQGFTPPQIIGPQTGLQQKTNFVTQDLDRNALQILNNPIQNGQKPTALNINQTLQSNPK